MKIFYIERTKKNLALKKTILITGASSGIGRATAKLFAGKGWNVAATMRTPHEEKELNQIDGIRIYKLDVTIEEDMKSIIPAVMRDFSQVDVLLNNAGYGAVGPLEKSTDREVRQQFEVNLFGVINLTREAIPVFRSQGNGLIINVSSVVGRITVPLYTMYSSSKWALEGFSEALQYELKQFNIGVKLIEPASTKTDFHTRSLNVFKNDKIHGYDDLEETVLEGMKKRNKKASKPEVVAKTIYTAATDGKVKLRYAPDKQAKLVLAARSLIPTGWFNKLVFKQQTKSSP